MEAVTSDRAVSSELLWLSADGVGAWVTVTVMSTEWDNDPGWPVGPNLPVIVTVSVTGESGLISASAKHLI